MTHEKLVWENGEARSSLGDLYSVCQLSSIIWVTEKNGTSFTGWRPSREEAIQIAENDYQVAMLRTNQPWPIPKTFVELADLADTQGGMISATAIRSIHNANVEAQRRSVCVDEDKKLFPKI